MAAKTGFDSNLTHGDIARLVWEQGLPYFTPGAVEYMEQVICQNSRAFEWGAGGSTLWFAARVSSVVSIEHQRQWYERVSERLRGIENVDLRFIPHQPYEPYANAISGFPSEHFSLVLVDGRERVHCIQRAMSKVASGGLLVLDNSERPRYASGIELLADWKRLDFPDRWVTTVFVKPEK